MFEFFLKKERPTMSNLLAIELRADLIIYGHVAQYRMQLKTRLLS